MQCSYVIYHVGVLLVIAAVHNVCAQEVKLPRKYTPKEKVIVLSKKAQGDLITFVIGLLGSGPLFEVPFPNCSFTTGNVRHYLLHSNRIKAVARTPAIVTATVYKTVIVVRIKRIGLVIGGNIIQSFLAIPPPRPRTFKYSATPSNISIVFVYHREARKVYFCRCRVNDVAFRLEYPPIGPRTSTKNITTFIQPIHATWQFKTKMKNCIRTIIKDGLCDYFTSEINNRKRELEKLVS